MLLHIYSTNCSCSVSLPEIVFQNSIFFSVDEVTAFRFLKCHLFDIKKPNTYTVAYTARGLSSLIVQICVASSC